jgi:murein DD-endopeptidase MepM/ murein hydrolase activator NlpD
MGNRKYHLDLNDLQYKQIKLPLKKKLTRLIILFAGTLVISFFYGALIEKIFGSPEEKVLRQELDNMKLQYSMLGLQMDKSLNLLKSLRLSDDIRYRPVLSMDSIPESFRSPGVGGVDRNEDLYGYENSGLMITLRNKTDEIKQKALIQFESFIAVSERSEEYKREMDHIPWICPVRVTIRRGDGVKFREVHPVLGTPQWHHGQDFNAPYGTDVFATGAGRIIEAGWNSGGFGNHVVIDHGYGYQTTYGHLSSIRVSRGQNISRGEIIGLSGSTGTSSGPHLHYQIDLYGKHKNPLSFFNDDLTEEEYLEMIQILSRGTKFN